MCALNEFFRRISRQKATRVRLSFVCGIKRRELKTFLPLEFFLCTVFGSDLFFLSTGCVLSKAFILYEPTHVFFEICLFCMLSSCTQYFLSCCLAVVLFRKFTISLKTIAVYGMLSLYNATVISVTYT